jgi:hypothetical protein
MSSSDDEDARVADDTPLTASDERVNWLGEKVGASLGCEPGLFADCVASDEQTRDRVEAFLRGASLWRPLVVFQITPQRHDRSADHPSILPLPSPSR